MKVFVDAWAWIAMVSNGDRWHTAASLEARRLREEGARLITTNLALYEAYTRAGHDAGRDAAVALHRLVQQSRREPLGLTVAYVHEALEQEGWGIFEAYRDKTLSFADCVAFALMRREGIATAFTGDDHFRQMGFVTVPAAAHPEQRGAGT
jgi:predicted nucleic acid-binding protein